MAESNKPVVDAPVIFFDLASAWLLNEGVVRVELEIARHTTAPTGAAHDFAVAAHLRMSLEGCRRLRQALEDVEKVAAVAIRQHEEAIVRTADGGEGVPAVLKPMVN